MGKKRRTRRKSPKQTKAKQKRLEIGLDELRALLAQARTTPLSAQSYDHLLAAVETLAFITQELEESTLTIKRLKKLLFGPGSEKTKDVFGGKNAPTGGASGEDESTSAASGEGESTGAASGEGESTGDVAEEDKSSSENPDSEEREGKSTGHGRRPASSYTGAERLRCAHETLEHGQRCPNCQKGKVYRLKPSTLVRVRGVAPLSARVYELERLRCSLCGKIFKAQTPEGVGEEKYDESAAAMMALLKYGTGLPFLRMERLGEKLGVPLPASTQWDVVHEAADNLGPIYKALLGVAAQGELLHFDDTKGLILALKEMLETDLDLGKSERKGIHITGVLSKVEERQVSLFLTGREHAGENLGLLLEKRSEALKDTPPIQMSDALSSNFTADYESIVAKCLAHARRNFVNVSSSFPTPVKRVLDDLGLVYKYDEETKLKQMSPEARLAYHQEKSKPLMDALKKYLTSLMEEKLVEPNSSMGKAIKYLNKHWEGLTRFLEVAGAPLDNNAAERILKRAILHRKNSLFFKSMKGALVGDIMMSVIYTCELNGINPFEYLIAILKNAGAVRLNPEAWLPWNYVETLATRS